MSTLIAVYNSEGCVGRCDAKCYDAQHPDCDCVCGGKNHGAGKKKALENVRELSEKMIDDYCERTGIDKKNVKVDPWVNQLNLF